MNITLTITGSAATLARVLSLLDNSSDQIELPLVIAAPEPVVAPVQVVETPVMPEVSAAAPTVPGEPEFDSSGLAWDERIHSAQRGTTNDGKWRKRRNVDDAVYNAVEAELRARYGQPVAVATPVQPVPIMPMPTVNDEGNGGYVAMAPGAVAVANVASEPTPVTAPTQTIDFHTIMGVVGSSMANGSITPDYLVGLVGEINGQLGTQMQSFTDMAALPHAVQYAYSALVRDGKA